MIGSLRLRSLKAICLIIRILSRKLYFKSRWIEQLYRWSDLKIYGLGRIYIFPDFVYRVFVSVLDFIINWNTLDWQKVRSKKIGIIADYLIHRIDDKFRFGEHTYMAPPVTGQDSRKQ